MDWVKTYEDLKIWLQQEASEKTKFCYLETTIDILIKRIDELEKCLKLINKLLEEEE